MNHWNHCLGPWGNTGFNSPLSFQGNASGLQRVWKELRVLARLLRQRSSPQRAGQRPKVVLAHEVRLSPGTKPAAPSSPWPVQMRGHDSSGSSNPRQARNPARQQSGAIPTRRPRMTSLKKWHQFYFGPAFMPHLFGSSSHPCKRGTVMPILQMKELSLCRETDCIL